MNKLNKESDKTQFEASMENQVEPLNRMTEFISKTVKNEENLIKLLILSMFSAFTPDPINLGIEGPPGEGKTYPVVKVAQLFPEKNVLMLGGLSPTALVHDHGILIDQDGRLLQPVLDKKYLELESVTDKKKEDKIKREIADLYKNAYRLINLQNKIMIFLESPHKETWSKLRPILSHDVWETTFKFTDRIHKNGPMTAITVIMRGWPSVIYTSADAKSDGIWDQIKSRFLIVSPEMGSDKYKAAIKLLGEQKGIPKPSSIYQKEREELNWCKKYILALSISLKNKLKPFYENYMPKDVNITWIPYNGKLIEAFPKTKGQRMRDFANFLRVLQASSIIQAFNRPVVTIDGDKFIITTISDLKLVKNILNRSTVFAKQGQHIVNFFNNIILPIWENCVNEDSSGIIVKDIVEKCRKTGDPKSEDTIRKNYLKPLVNDGIVTLERDDDDKRRYLVKVLKTEISDDAGFFRDPLNFSFDDFNNAISDLNKYNMKIKFYTRNFFNCNENDLIDCHNLYQKYFFIPILYKGSPSPTLPAKIETFQTFNISYNSGFFSTENKIDEMNKLNSILDKPIPLGGLILDGGEG